MTETLKDSLTAILEKYPETRDDDYLLAYKYLCEYRKTMVYKELGTVLHHFGDLKLPKIETVSRLRRLIQSQREDLQAKEKAAQKRKALETKTKEDIKKCS